MICTNIIMKEGADTFNRLLEKKVIIKRRLMADAKEKEQLLQSVANKGGHPKRPPLP